jgi:Reverse transcriptase (RNA-dependent DNA polymerase)
VGVWLHYVLAFPQAPVEQELYMKIPRGIKVESETEYALKVEQNLYGQKQTGRVWNLHLVQKLIEIGFEQSDSVRLINVCFTRVPW